MKIHNLIRIFLLIITFFVGSIYFLSPSKIFAVDNNILYQDSFDSEESLTNWTITGDWKIEPNNLRVLIPSTNSLSTIFYEPSSNWDNYSIKVKILSENGVDQNIGFRKKDDKNHYFVSFRYFQNEHGGNVALFLRENDSISTLQNYPLQKGNFELNHWYEVKIEILNNNIKVFLNQDKIIDYIDQNNTFEKGGLLFQSWSGNISNVLMRFDDLLVESLDANEPIVPTLLVPGLGASWDFKAMTTGGTSNNWKMVPFVGVYDNFKQTFLDNGFQDKKNYDEFFYDWRKNVSDLADDLKPRIEQMYQENSNQKINLVGHSLGGLVARAYVQKYGKDKINKLVTVGSPHQGSVKAYLAWEGAEIVDPDRITWADIGMNLILYLNSVRYPSLLATVRGIAPSIKDLLPTFDFLKKSGTEDVISFTGITQKNDFLLNLNNSLDTDTKDLVKTLNGGQLETLEWLKVQNPGWLDQIRGLWLDGKPQERLYTENGDRHILDKSASPADFSGYAVLGNHDEIMQNTEGLTKILEALDLELTPAVVNKPTPQTPILIFSLHSPANIKVLGPSLEAGFDANNCSNCYWLAEEKIILINNAPLGDYKIILTPENSGGDWQIDIGKFINSGVYWQNLVGQIQVNQTQEFNFKLNDQPQITIETSGLNQAIIKLQQIITYYQNNYSALKNFKNLQAALKNLQKANNSNSEITKKVLLLNALKILYQTRINLKGNIYLKNEIFACLEDINNYYASLNNYLPQPLSLPINKTMLLITEKKFQKLEKQLQKKPVFNSELGATLEILQEYLNQARQAYEQKNINQAFIKNFGSEFLMQEAESLLKI